jgi:hypothetical protein
LSQAGAGLRRAADLGRLFNPRGIIVLGTSPDLNKIPGRILAALHDEE